MTWVEPKVLASSEPSLALALSSEHSLEHPIPPGQQLPSSSGASNQSFSDSFQTSSLKAKAGSPYQGYRKVGVPSKPSIFLQSVSLSGASSRSSIAKSPV